MSQRHVVRAGGALALLSALVGVWCEIDRHMMERAKDEQALAQASYEAKVEQCEACGGKWYRGECVR